jgi:cob(I)alamin adenosyltransferase
MTDEEAQNREHKLAMKALQAERRSLMKTKAGKGGLLIVHTGDGKGKSTAAFGMVLRSLGWGLKVGIVQFVKGKWKTGERQFFGEMGDRLDYVVSGEGFTWDSQDRERDIAAARAGWERAKEMIADPSYHLIVLDELNIALRYKHLPLSEVLEVLEGRPDHTHVCITGRNAKQPLIDAADLVTEFNLVKHPFEQGFKAQRGVEY